MLADRLCEVASTLINGAIRLDPDAREKLRDLDGVTVSLVCSEPSIECYAQFVGRHVDVFPGNHHAPHVMISGPLLDLVAWLSPKATTSSRIRIDGDPQLLMALQQFASRYQPELTDALDGFLGPSLSDQVLGAVEIGFDALRNILGSVGDETQRAAQRSFANTDDANRLLDRMERFNLRVDRLAARVNHLERSTSG